MKKRRAIPHKVRLAVALRDRGVCGICGQPILSAADLEIDHAVPLHLGGSDHFQNLRATHWSCNQRRDYAELACWSSDSWGDLDRLDCSPPDDLNVPSLFAGDIPSVASPFDPDREALFDRALGA
jgi:hypothetical protein